jgi:hypothetical protein
MRIVVGIPVYNDIDHVDRQIDNILKVGYDDVVILDDCSTDGTYERLQDLTKECNNIHIFKNDVNSVEGHTGNRWKQVTDICRDYSPDWVMVRAMDEIFCCSAYRDGDNLLRKNLYVLQNEGANMISFSHVDLWRSEWWYRTDGYWGARVQNQPVNSMWKNDTGWVLLSQSGIHLGAHKPSHFDVPIHSRGIDISNDRSIVILHYGMASPAYLAKTLDYQISTAKSIGGRAAGMPSRVPPPNIWHACNGYKAAYEKDMVLVKVDQKWFDKPVPESEPPVVDDAVFKVLFKYDKKRAEEYKSFMNL